MAAFKKTASRWTHSQQPVSASSFKAARFPFAGLVSSHSGRLISAAMIVILWLLSALTMLRMGLLGALLCEVLQLFAGSFMYLLLPLLDLWGLFYLWSQGRFDPAAHVRGGLCLFAAGWMMAAGLMMTSEGMSWAAMDSLRASLPAFGTLSFSSSCGLPGAFLSGFFTMLVSRTGAWMFAVTFMLLGLGLCFWDLLMEVLGELDAGRRDPSDPKFSLTRSIGPKPVEEKKKEQEVFFKDPGFSQKEKPAFSMPRFKHFPAGAGLRQGSFLQGEPTEEAGEEDDGLELPLAFSRPSAPQKSSSSQSLQTDSPVSDPALTQGSRSYQLPPLSLLCSPESETGMSASQRSVFFKELLSQVPADLADRPLMFALGKDPEGRNIYGRLDTMPHLLIAAENPEEITECLHSILCSILLRTRPDEVRMLLIDLKKAPLHPYHGIPQLLAPVIFDASSAQAALKVIVEMMEQRYSLFEELGVRNISSYNEAVLHQKPEREALFRIVVVLNEPAALTVAQSEKILPLIERIARQARAAGIHLIAAGRPRAGLIFGLQAEIPSRIAFRLLSEADSRLIVNQSGAETLSPEKEMLFLDPKAGSLKRLQGVRVENQEVEAVCSWVKSQARGSTG